VVLFFPDLAKSQTEVPESWANIHGNSLVDFAMPFSAGTIHVHAEQFFSENPVFDTHLMLKPKDIGF
jgi:hypothetical protein